MTRTSTCLAVLLACLVTPLLATPVFEGDGPWVVRIPVIDTEAVEALQAEGFDIWRIEAEKGFTRLAVDRLGLDLLRARGFAPTMDRRQTELMTRARTATKAGAGIPGFPCYRTVEETQATAAQIVVDHPDLATLIDIGDSWEKQAGVGGYDLQVLRLTQSAVAGPKPSLFLNTALHAREYTTAELGTRFAEHLVDRYGEDPDVTWLLDHHEIHFNLQANPDGRKRAETGLSWRKNANNDHCANSNDRGIDLNRNFAFQWGCCGGSSGSACSGTFRGPSAESEPETMALVDYVRGIFPDQRSDDLESPAPSDATGVLIDVHSFGEDVLWSYGFRTAPPPEPNGSAIYSLGRKMAFFNGYRPQHGSLGTVDGSTKDFAYGELGLPGFTLELGNSFFESCAAFEGQVWPDNRDALIYVLKIVRTPYLTPGGPDAVGLTTTPQVVAPGDLVTVTTTIDDSRFSSANGVEPTHTIAGADLWLDDPPWVTEGVSTAMTAVDGTLDSDTEAMTATLDTTGWPLGRRTLFVEGRDTNGSTGSASAVFVYVIDPLVAPVLEGTVRDALTAQPIAGAEVALGPFTTTADGVGAFALQVPADTYSLTVSAAGYADDTQAVSLADFDTVQRAVFLRPFVEQFRDTVEAGAGDWVAQAPWAISDETFASPTHAWSDSPGGNYGNNLNVSLTSPTVDLSDLEQVRLRFEHRYDFESGFDFGIVEVSDGGAWQEVAVFDGFGDWGPAVIDVPMLAGAATAQVRFRVDTDVNTVADGWHVDDIVFEGLGATPPAVVFFDDFESGDTNAWSSTTGF